MLKRVWRTRNTLTLLLEMQTSAATIENSVENPEKLKIDLLYNLAITLLGIYTEEARIERHVYHNVHSIKVYNSLDMEATWKMNG